MLTPASSIYPGRKVVVFGTGMASQEISTHVDHVDYYVDNDEERWNTEFMARAVKNPKVLLEENKNDSIIVVASMYHTEISEQLKSMGFEEHLHFVYGSNAPWIGIIGKKEEDLKKAIKELWDQEQSSEVDFWNDIGIPRDEYRFNTKLRPLQPGVGQYLDIPIEGMAKILDVGAGPATLLGNYWKGKEIELVSIDPLADQYNKIIEMKGWTPMVKTVKGDGEKLHEMFPENSFNMVFSNNAIDHSYDPITIILNMVHVVKPGGRVLLHHVTNEATHQNYVGLHQWNFDEQSGEFLVWNPAQIVSITRLLEKSATVNISRTLLFDWNTDEEWITVVIEKNGR